jgi:hypothetical protein
MGVRPPPFGTNKINHLWEFNFSDEVEKGMTLPMAKKNDLFSATI